MPLAFLFNSHGFQPRQKRVAEETRRCFPAKRCMNSNPIKGVERTETRKSSPAESHKGTAPQRDEARAAVSL